MRPTPASGRAKQLQLMQINKARDEEPATGEPEPEMLFFRAQTSAILHHFLEICSQVGRVPSILGREFFRAKVTYHQVPSFEDQALFMHDIERCLAKLPSRYTQIVAMVGVHNIPADQVASILGVSRSWVNRLYVEALDVLSEIFLKAGVLSYRHPDRRPWQAIRGDEQPARARIASAAKKPCGSVKVTDACQTAGPQRVAAQMPWRCTSPKASLERSNN